MYYCVITYDNTYIYEFSQKSAVLLAKPENTLIHQGVLTGCDEGVLLML